MRKSVIVCLGTIGSPTFNRCYDTILDLKNKDSRIKEVVVIKNKYPQCAWLNEMISHCRKATWCLQLDEDMYLKENAISTLLDIAIKKESFGTGVGLAHGMLWDIFLEQPIGSLKLWRSKILRKYDFRDMMGSDRDVVRRIAKSGYKIVSTDEILGLHDSAPTDEIGAKKYFEYVQKIRKFNGEEKAAKFIRSIKGKNQLIYESCVRAMSSEILDRSKNGKN